MAVAAARMAPGPVRLETCLPPEIERLLVDVVADGFAIYSCGPRAAPLALVAAYRGEDLSIWPAPTRHHRPCVSPAPSNAR